MVYLICIYNILALISLQGFYISMWISKWDIILYWRCYHFICTLQYLLCIKHHSMHGSVSLYVVSRNYLYCSGDRCYELYVNIPQYVCHIRIYLIGCQCAPVKNVIFCNILSYQGSLCTNLWYLVPHHQLAYPLLWDPRRK